MNAFPHGHRTCHLLALLLLLTVFDGCQRNTSSTLPHDLDGIWTTDDPRDDERFFELSPAFVIIATAHNESSVQWIDKVKVEQAPSSITYLTYTTDRSNDKRNQMALVFTPANGGEIRLRGRDQVWRRKQR